MWPLLQVSRPSPAAQNLLRLPPPSPLVRMKGTVFILCSFVPFLGPQHNLNLYLFVCGGFYWGEIYHFSLPMHHLLEAALPPSATERPLRSLSSTGSPKQAANHVLMVPGGLAPPVKHPVTSVGSPLLAIMKTRSPGRAARVLTDGRRNR